MITTIILPLNVFLAVVLSLAGGRFFNGSNLLKISLVGGAITPLLLAGVAYVLSPDLVQFMGVLPGSASLVSSLLLFASLGVLGGFTLGKGVLVGLGMLAGWGLFLLLALLSAPGVVFTHLGIRLMYPAFNSGHPWLLAVLAMLMLLLFITNKLHLWHKLAIAFTVVYLLGGVSFYAYTRNKAELTQGQLFPASSWPRNWWVVESKDEEWNIKRLRVGKAPQPIASLPQWNNQPELLYLLRDPIVANFYYDVFLHPIAKIQQNENGQLLTISEALPVAKEKSQSVFILDANQREQFRIYTLQKLPKKNSKEKSEEKS